MIYEECKKTALAFNSNINTCHEYKVAYHFFEKESDSVDDNGVVIIKETGRRMNFIDFICEFSPERDFKVISF